MNWPEPWQSIDDPAEAVGLERELRDARWRPVSPSRTPG
jgi:hypothetical protein